MSVISRQRVLEILCEECAYRCKTEEVKLKCCFNYHAISTLPCADVKPVVRGEWEIIDRNELGERLFSCPLCGGSVWRFTAPNYCLNCGADMQKWAKDNPERSEE